MFRNFSVSSEDNEKTAVVMFLVSDALAQRFFLTIWTSSRKLLRLDGGFGLNVCHLGAVLVLFLEVLPFRNLDVNLRLVCFLRSFLLRWD